MPYMKSFPRSPFGPAPDYNSTGDSTHLRVSKVHFVSQAREVDGAGGAMELHQGVGEPGESRGGSLGEKAAGGPGVPWWPWRRKSRRV